jgi:hypothetical protein
LWLSFAAACGLLATFLAAPQNTMLETNVPAIVKP